jgi:hypothetical protein
MKTSKVILIITATVIVILVVIFSLILHHTIHVRRSSVGGQVTYRTTESTVIGDTNRTL